MFLGAFTAQVILSINIQELETVWQHFFFNSKDGER